MLRSILTVLALLLPGMLAAENGPAWPGDLPQRSEGEGPFERLILRGPIMIDGTGAPPSVPVDIVIENNRITEIRNVAMGGVFVADERRPQADDDTREFDLSGVVHPARFR